MSGTQQDKEEKVYFILQFVEDLKIHSHLALRQSSREE